MKAMDGAEQMVFANQIDDSFFLPHDVLVEQAVGRSEGQSELHQVHLKTERLDGQSKNI